MMQQASLAVLQNDKKKKVTLNKIAAFDIIPGFQRINLLIDL